MDIFILIQTLWYILTENKKNLCDPFGICQNLVQKMKTIEKIAILQGEIETPQKLHMNIFLVT